MGGFFSTLCVFAVAVHVIIHTVKLSDAHKVILAPLGCAVKPHFN